MPIYHLAEPADWAARTDVYETASLEGEGFIHCSTADQLDWVTREFYGNRTDVIVLEIDPAPSAKIWSTKTSTAMASGSRMSMGPSP